MPKRLEEKFLCKFSGELFPHIPEVDVSVLREPIAHIYYDEQRDNFTYNINATDRINRQFKAAYARHRQSKKNEQIAGQSQPNRILLMSKTCENIFTV